MVLGSSVSTTQQAANDQAREGNKSRRPTSPGPRSQTGDPTNLDRQQGIHTVLGGTLKYPPTKVPPLADNIWAIVERVFPTPTVAADPDPPPPPQPSAGPSQPPPKPAPKSGGRKRLAPLGGFTAPQSQPPAPKKSPTNGTNDENATTENGTAGNLPEEIALARLAGFADADQPAVHRFLKQRFGSRVTEVVNILRLWEAADLLFHAWRDEWTSDDDAYRASRALRYLRAAIQFAEALNLVSNYKHKSWYVHLAVFVVPQQLTGTPD